MRISHKECHVLTVISTLRFSIRALLRFSEFVYLVLVKLWFYLVNEVVILTFIWSIISKSLSAKIKTLVVKWWFYLVKEVVILTFMPSIISKSLSSKIKTNT